MSALAAHVSEQMGARLISRLAVLERDARGLTARAELASARSELVEIVMMWRRLLRRHDRGQDGRCPACRRWWGRRRRWPCPVWWGAHAFLMELDSDARRELTAPALAASSAPVPRGAAATARPGVTIQSRRARPGSAGEPARALAGSPVREEVAAVGEVAAAPGPEAARGLAGSFGATARSRV